MLGFKASASKPINIKKNQMIHIYIILLYPDDDDDRA